MSEEEIEELKHLFILAVTELNGEWGTYPWYDSFAEFETYEQARDWYKRFLAR